MSDHGDELLERQREHFNSIADRYHDARQGQNHLYLKRRMWDDVFRDLDDFRGRHIDVLEPMCGFCDGRDIVSSHLNPDLSYKGFDYSDSVVEIVRRERPGIDIWQADATKYRPAGQDFDLIILIGGLHHTPRDAATIVANLAPALRSGGIFVNFEPTHGNPIFKKVRDNIYSRNSLFDEQTEKAFAVDELVQMFEQSGLKLRKILYPGLLSYVLYYNPDAFPFLNVGNRGLVAATYALDKLFYGNAIGRTLSFATLSIWTKP
jgi:SAM-dependent methyltransferase